MPQTLLYAQDWAKGNSAFCSPNYRRMTIAGGTIVEPLYPEIAEAESCQILIGIGPNGENVLDATPGEHVTAGVIIYKSFAGVTQLEATGWFRPTTEALDSGLPYSLPLWFAINLGQNSAIETALGESFNDGTKWSWQTDANFLGINGTEHSGYLDRAYLENRWFAFRLRCSNAVGTTLPWIQWEVRRADQSTFTTVARRDMPPSGNPPYFDVTAFDSFGIGFAGLVQSTGLRILSGFSGDAASEPLGDCCATSGAAGGGTLNPDGSVNPIGPRQGVNAGVPPSYTPCTGGGTLAAATDPTDPQALDGVEDPILHVRFTPAASADQRWGASAINAGTTSPPIEARVLRYSAIPSEVLAGRDGVIPTPTFSVQVDDTDRRIRGWSQTSDRFFKDRFAEVLIEAYGERQLDTEARKLAAGYCVDWKFIDELIAEFTFADVLGWKRGALKRRVPQDTVDPSWAPDAPEDSLGRPVPWPYGEFNDEYDWSLDNNRLPVGILGGIPIGKGHTLNMTNLLVPGMGTVDWEAFLIGKVCKHVKNFYCWNGDNEEAVRGRIPIDVSFVTDWLVSSMSGWSSYFSDPFVRIVGTDGVTRDVEVGFLRGPRGYQARVTGRYPPTYNVCGIEETGDSTGLMISDGAHALAHFICYGVFGNHTFGVWGPIPTLPNGTPVINRASVDTVKTIFDLRITGGYPGAFVIGATGTDRKTGEQEVTERARGLDITLGRDHFGAIVFDTVNDVAAIASLTAFDDSSMRNFVCNPRVDWLENVKRYTWGPEPATGRNTGLERRITDDQSIDDWGEEGGDAVRLNSATRRKAVADDVARRELLRDSDMPYDGAFETNQRGTSLRVGQLITCLTEFSHWPSTEAHVVKVTGISELGNEDELLTRIEFDDVHRLLQVTALQSSIFQVGGLAVGPAWGNPVGSVTNGTAQPVGSVTNNTARRAA